MESNSATLLRALFNDANFVSFLKNISAEVYSAISESDDKEERKKKKFRKGYLGHVCNIGNKI